MRRSKSQILLLLPTAAVFIFVMPLLAVIEESFRTFTPGRIGAVVGAPLTIKNYTEFFGLCEVLWPNLCIGVLRVRDRCHHSVSGRLLYCEEGICECAEDLDISSHRANVFERVGSDLWDRIDVWFCRDTCLFFGVNMNASAYINIITHRRIAPLCNTDIDTDHDRRDTESQSSLE
ncbi:hypothetical protein NKH28_31875 [Mesorhizobium sp. M1227]|uniref:hypothetical protein n=1 Tax=Mesorhizobium sp. M1227 TaxID=2957071 RepID=UPI003338C734